VTRRYVKATKQWSTGFLPWQQQNTELRFKTCLVFFFANTSASKRWNNSCATETNNFKAIVSLELAHFNTRLCFVINGSVTVILKRKLLRT
jgi:hypothetical protein